MLTGRAAYTAAGFSLGLDILADPTVVATDWSIAMRTAAWEFAGCNGNQLADDGDFVTLTKRINGGLIGLGSREAYLELATKALT
jgi:putative chitinase